MPVPVSPTIPRLRLLELATVVVAIGCATGGESSDAALTFGPGNGPGPTEVTVATEMPLGTSGGTPSDGSNSNSGDTADTNDPDCQDEDGDHYGPSCAAGEDCDDDDPDVNPGAPETCDGVDENCDEMIDNGCECPDDGVSGNCNMPTDIGMLVLGDNKLGVVGNVPTEGAIDWYVVHYPTMTRPGEGTPTIQFAINEGDAFVFDVVTGQCEAGGATCTSGGTAGAAVGLTSWSFVDDDAGCCAPPMDALVAWPNDLFLRVYRTSTGASCAAYQLQFSR
jgi:Putative metal-binding motif